MKFVIQASNQAKREAAGAEHWIGSTHLRGCAATPQLFLDHLTTLGPFSELLYYQAGEGPWCFREISEQAGQPLFRAGHLSATATSVTTMAQEPDQTASGRT